LSKENTTLEQFFENEVKRIETERKEALKEKGYNQLFKIPKGETKLTVVYATPRILEGNFGNQRVFKIKVGKEDYDLALSEKSPLYRFVILSLGGAKKNIDVRVTRVGDGKNTRYDAVLE